MCTPLSMLRSHSQKQLTRACIGELPVRLCGACTGCATPHCCTQQVHHDCSLLEGSSQGPHGLAGTQSLRVPMFLQRIASSGCQHISVKESSEWGLHCCAQQVHSWLQACFRPLEEHLKHSTRKPGRLCPTHRSGTFEWAVQCSTRYIIAAACFKP